MKIIISSILIITSFFLGYFFAINKEKKKINQKENLYVNLEILKTKIKINKSDQIKITINGKKIEKSEISLK